MNKQRFPKFIARFFAYLLVIFVYGCNKEETPTDEKIYPEYIVFGKFFSGCATPECNSIFKMDSQSCMKDVSAGQPSTSTAYEGNYSKLVRTEAYVELETIFENKLPKEIFGYPNGQIGTSPSWNSTFYYFEYKTKTETRFWILDGSFDGNLGTTLTTFINDMQNAINIASV